MQEATEPLTAVEPKSIPYALDALEPVISEKHNTGNYRKHMKHFENM